MLSWKAEEHGERCRTEEGRQHLDRNHRGICISRGSGKMYHASVEPAVGHEAGTYSHSYGDEHHQGIRKPGHSGEIILIGNIPEAVCEGDPGGKQYHRAHNHIAEIGPEAEAVEQYAEKGSDETRRHIGESLRKIRHAYPCDEEIQEKRGCQGGCSISQTAAEDDAECGASYSCGHVLFPERLGWKILDFLQPGACFLQGKVVCLNVTGELIDSSHLVQAGPLDRDELGVGIGTPGCEYSIAEHEKVLTLHSVMGSDSFHRILYAGNFRPILKQDSARFRGKSENFFGPYFVNCIFHTAKIWKKSDK